jgi:hypothetical protein
MRKSRFTDEKMFGSSAKPTKAPVADVAKKHGCSPNVSSTSRY